MYPQSTHCTCAIDRIQALTEKAKSMQGIRQWPYKAIARALEVIPRTLIQNCGGSTIRQLTALRVRFRRLICDSIIHLSGEARAGGGELDVGH